MSAEVKIGRYLVDLDALFSIENRCDGTSCGPAEYCCSKYDICIGKKEMSRITGYAAEAARFAPELLEDDELKNIFDEEEPGLYSIDKDDDDLCVFAYKDAGAVRCSLHSAALRLGDAPYKVKPEACVLWPLAISEGKPIFISVQDDAFVFPCNTQRKQPASPLCPAIAEIVECLFGPKFLKQLEAEGKKAYPAGTVDRS